MSAGPEVLQVVTVWAVVLLGGIAVWALAGMPGLFVACVVLACSWAPQAHAACRWTQPGDSLRWQGDKRAHVAWSGAGALAVVAADAALGLDLTPAQQWGLVMLPGLVREVRTGCSGNTTGGFSWQDVTYNAIGAAAGVGLGNGVRVLLTPRSVYVYKEW